MKPKKPTPKPKQERPYVVSLDFGPRHYQMLLEIQQLLKARLSWVVDVNRPMAIRAAVESYWAQLSAEQQEEADNGSQQANHP